MELLQVVVSTPKRRHCSSDFTPSITVMDFNIATVLYFASRCHGRCVAITPDVANCDASDQALRFLDVNWNALLDQRNISEPAVVEVKQSIVTLSFDEKRQLKAQQKLLQQQQKAQERAQEKEAKKAQFESLTPEQLEAQRLARIKRKQNRVDTAVTSAASDSTDAKSVDTGIVSSQAQSISAMDGVESEPQRAVGGNADFDTVSKARVLMSGLGADELFAGYGRHRTSWRVSLSVPSTSSSSSSSESKRDEDSGEDSDQIDEWLESKCSVIKAQTIRDVSRLWRRNFCRDDRCISHWSRELRLPYCDEELLEFVWALWQHDESGTAMGLLCDFRLPPGLGDKLVVRAATQMLGLYKLV